MNRRDKHFARKLVAACLPKAVLRYNEDRVSASLFRRTDEGWDRDDVVAWPDEDGMHLVIANDGVDCDGRLSWVGEYIAIPLRRAQRGGCPWRLHKLDSEQRDYSAEACGY